MRCSHSDDCVGVSGDGDGGLKRNEYVSWQMISFSFPCTFTCVVMSGDRGKVMQGYEVSCCDDSDGGGGRGGGKKTNNN